MQALKDQTPGMVKETSGPGRSSAEARPRPTAMSSAQQLPAVGSTSARRGLRQLRQLHSANSDLDFLSDSHQLGNQKMEMRVQDLLSFNFSI